MRCLTRFRILNPRTSLLIAVVCAAGSAPLAIGQNAWSDSSFSAASSVVVHVAASDMLPDAPGEMSALAAPRLPVAAAMAGGGREAFEIAPTVAVHKDPFSRMAIGAAVSPLGVGVNSALLLTGVFDARLSGNYFAYNNGRIEVDEFNVSGNLRLASAAASLDLYPFNTPIRFSAGLMFLNDNHAAAVMRIVPGTSFTLNDQTFYAGGTNTAPLMGNAALGFHSIRPAPTLTFGLGKFVPRSDRHWSYPSEFGVAFTGGPSIDLALTGTVCADPQLTQCANAADTSNPVGAAFQSALQAKLAGWRHSLNRVPIFPIMSGGVSYSFNTAWQRTPKAKF